MVVIDRRLARLIRYRTIFFPTRETSTRIVDDLRPGCVARLFWTPTEINQARRSASHQRSTTLGIDLRRTHNRIWNEFAKGCRYDIRQAEKEIDSIEISRNNQQSAHDFLRLHNSFPTTKGDVRLIPSQVLKRYGENSDIFVAYQDGRALCGHMLLRDSHARRARLLFSASRRLEDPETAKACGLINRYLHWFEIRAYLAEKFATYDLGGIREGEKDGITRFKESFGGRAIAENTYLCACAPRLVNVVHRVFHSMRTARLHPA